MKKSILFLFIILNCTMCMNAQQDSKEILKPTYPEGKWKVVKPEKLGYSSEKLNKAKAKFDEIGGMAALIIVNGHIIADWGLTDKSFDCRSIRKSLISSLYGIYMNKGMFNNDQTLSELNINDGGKLNESEKETKIKYLMSSSSGIYLSAAFEEKAHIKKPDRGSFKPGAHFQYNNWDFNTLSTIFNKMTNKDLFKAFEEDIAQPLQMEHFDGLRSTAYIYQPGLSEHPAYLFSISTKDLARYGLLYLNEGNWKGKQIIPNEWIVESTSAQIQTGEKFYYNYGYLWWVTKGDNSKGRKPFLARGAQSQYMYIDPNNNLIVVFRDNPDGIKKVRKADAYPLIGAVYGAKMK